jgi:hypothetical protein
VGLIAVCIDCTDAWTLAHWWAETLGYRVREYGPSEIATLREQGVDRPEDDPAVAVDPVGGPGPTVWFNRVPEPKQGKNRVHVDVTGDVEAIVARGGTVIERLPRWTVMADPEGNEFCLFPAD